MIVGNGFLASAFADDYLHTSDVLIFASGVSNSLENDSAAFMRERTLLRQMLGTKKQIVYFGTCSLYDPDLEQTPYVMHKREMENIVRESPCYTIFRLPQLVGKSHNTNTLANFINAKITKNEHFSIWGNATRNLIDISDVTLIVKALLSDEKYLTQTINIACPTSLPILKIVKIFELVLGKNAHYSVVDKGGNYSIDVNLAEDVAKKVGINFDEAYVERIVSKYYG